MTEYGAESGEKDIHYANTWLPVNWRHTGGGPALAPEMQLETHYVDWFYREMSWNDQYVVVFYSVAQSLFGSGIGPVTIN